MAAIWLSTALKTLFSVLECLMLATLIYTLSIDGLPFRKDLLTPWMAATLVDFYINIVALAAWIIYRESSWISATIWIILLVCFGSITTCAYIILQLFKLSSLEASQDPIYYVLLRHQNKDVMEQKGKCFPVVLGRVVFSALGCLMLGTLAYTLFTDGSPFRKELFTPTWLLCLSRGTWEWLRKDSFDPSSAQLLIEPSKTACEISWDYEPIKSSSATLLSWMGGRWMSATLIDFYINVVALSVWVAYKETSWSCASFWIVLFICCGSITTCVYIVRQLFQLSSQDPTYIVLVKSDNRH